MSREIVDGGTLTSITGRLQTVMAQLRTAERVKGAHDELSAWYPFMTRRGRKFADQRLRALEKTAQDLEREG